MATKVLQQSTNSSETDETEVSVHLFTCLSCHVAFHNSGIQREHYRSDWHRYNLKRKVVELPPISAEAFAQKIHQQNQKLTVESEKPTNFSCDCCNKQYFTLNAYENHLQSKKHLLQAENQHNAPQKLQSSKPSTTLKNPEIYPQTQEEVNQIIEKKIASAVRLTELDCLFCSKKSDSFEVNLDHMVKQHSFFIPDIEYLTDIKGLIKYLGEKISIANMCLYCNEKGKTWHSMEAVRCHMNDKGHCKIEYEDDADLEYAEFYDFAMAGEDNDDWVDLGEDTETTSDALGRPQLYDGRVSDTVELLLPNGKKAGHRAHAKIWNQNLKPVETREAVLINRLVGQYRTLGWYGVEQKELQLKKRMARIQCHAAHDLKSRVAFKANGLQRFFRMQNPM